MKLAFIDLDGILADPEQRFARAASIKQEWLATQAEINADLEALMDEWARAKVERDATTVYWREVFNPAFISLDVPIAGAREGVIKIKLDRYEVIYITSRPETMRLMTEQWLYDHALDHHIGLLMKPLVAQYIKTPTWKALTIHQTALFMKATEVIVVDDEDFNRVAINAWSGTECTIEVFDNVALERPAADDEPGPGPF